MLDYLLAGGFVLIAVAYVIYHYRSSRKAACDKCGDVRQT
jgi:cbb3-type cytochrome oxidase subunit 3